MASLDTGPVVVTDLTAPFRARIEDVRRPPNVAAGCNYLVVASLVLMLRGTTEDPEPVEVELEADGSWRVCDGRHRFLAAVMAGRPDVLCVQALNPTELT